MNLSPVAERLTAPGPKRLLALDGGGIRGLITLGFLERIETLLRQRHGSNELRLGDYFDLIGGTSTGAIIAAALAMGWTVTDTKAMYLRLGAASFKPALPTWLPDRVRSLALFYPAPRLSISLGAREIGIGGGSRWASRFEAGPLEELLRASIGKDVTLGSEAIRTGICVVTQRVDTGSTWLLHNNPNGRYFDQNKDLPLWKLVRASTAAPVYFVPERIDYGKGQGAFIDGGVSMANNPGLQLFLMATLPGYNYNWATGGDKLLLVSVGAGTWERNDDVERSMRSRVWDWAASVPGILMDEATKQNQLLLQALSETPTWWEIDREVDSRGRYRLTSEPLLTYLRYNVELEPKALEDLGLKRLASPRTARVLREMSATENRHDLALIGERAGERSIFASHFPIGFDVVSS